MLLETERLILRRWTESDLTPLAAIHADPEVMTWLGDGPLSRKLSDAYAWRCDEHFQQNGFGPWAVERREDGTLIGVTGLRRVLWDDHPMAPSVEITWRQARFAWGQGYVTEAAKAALADGFERVGLEEILSWTAVINVRSQAVMRRIGMVRKETNDFELQTLPAGHPLRKHVVFSVGREK
jgi:RimJ/RimL family protein N-acetyltransferase